MPSSLLCLRSRHFSPCKLDNSDVALNVEIVRHMFHSCGDPSASLLSTMNASIIAAVSDVLHAVRVPKLEYTRK